jgi:ATP-dependent protease HslVU (ClpYQ) peptidase subunit
MTTILADSKLRVMVSDSSATDGQRSWSVRKVYRVRGALVGLAGTVSNFQGFLSWYRGGMKTPPEFDFDDNSALVLRADGLWTFDATAPALQKSPSRESIGSGAMAAIAAYEALGWSNPRRAVQIACRHDASSRAPVRTYLL